MASFAGRAAAVLVWLLLAWAPLTAQAQARHAFDLPAQPLADALRSVGRTAHVNVAFDPAEIGARRAPALKGEYSAFEALQRLLAGSGLRLRVTTGGSFWIEASDANDPRGGARSSSAWHRRDDSMSAQCPDRFARSS